VLAIRSHYFIGDVNIQMEKIAEDVNDKELELAHRHAKEYPGKPDGFNCISLQLEHHYL
jgi:hypothetical protein